MRHGDTHQNDKFWAANKCCPDWTHSFHGRSRSANSKRHSGATEMLKNTKSLIVIIRKTLKATFKKFFIELMNDLSADFGEISFSSSSSSSSMMMRHHHRPKDDPVIKSTESSLLLLLFADCWRLVVDDCCLTSLEGCDLLLQHPSLVVNLLLFICVQLLQILKLCLQLQSTAKRKDGDSQPTDPLTLFPSLADDYGKYF